MTVNSIYLQSGIEMARKGVSVEWPRGVKMNEEDKKGS
jgi:hypothetical protein